MRKKLQISRLIRAALVLLLIGSVSEFAKAQTIVNVNGDFSGSTVGQSTGITNWNLEGAAFASFQIVADPDNAESKLLRAEITDKAGAANPWSIQPLHQNVPLVSGTEYALRLRIRVESTSGTSRTINLDAGHAVSPRYGISIPVNEWTIIQTTAFEYAGGNNYAGIHLAGDNVVNGDVFYIDYLYYVDTTAPAIEFVNVNGGFGDTQIGQSTGITNWLLQGPDYADYEIVADPDDASNRLLLVELFNREGAANPWDIQALHQNYTLTPGNSYKFVVRIKADPAGGGTPNINFDAGHDVSPRYGISLTPDVWTVLETTEFTFAAGGSQQAGLHFGAPSNSNGDRFYIDYVYIVQTAEGEPDPDPTPDPVRTPNSELTAGIISEWGFDPARVLSGWNIETADNGTSVTISGSAAPTGWVAVQGRFKEETINQGETLVITGKANFSGGNAMNGSLDALRYGVFFDNYDESAQAGALNTATNTWTGNENVVGYLWVPVHSPAQLSWQGVGQQGSWGGKNRHAWISTNGGNDYVLGATDYLDPWDRPAPAGIYDFAFSFTRQATDEVLVKFYLESEEHGVTFQGQAVDAAKDGDGNPKVTTTFNFLNFGINSGSSATSLSIGDVSIRKGNPITLPRDRPVSIDGFADEIPSTFGLRQNYPNPFNPTTSISYDLPTSAFVTVEVYNMLGQMVTRLVNQEQGAGVHTVSFDATGLSSGIYIYRLSAGNFTTTRKMMLVK